MKVKVKCAICGLDAEQYRSGEIHRADLDCARCGRYRIWDMARAPLERSTESYLISAWTRDQYEQDKENPPILTRDLVRALIRDLPHHSPSRKRLLLLRAIAARSDSPGAGVVISEENDTPLAWAKNPQEFTFHLHGLMNHGHVGVEIHSSGNMVHVTPAGWDFLEANKDVISGDQCFVAMSFDKTLESLWQHGIRPAIEAAGFRPFRVDEEPHIDRIDARIVAGIKDSRFVVADVTLQRQGVYYEAGFAQGLGLPVIWMVRDDDLPNVHFDTRQYNHIVWTDPAGARDELTNLILAIIGHGPLKPPAQE